MGLSFGKLTRDSLSCQIDDATIRVTPAASATDDPNNSRYIDCLTYIGPAGEPASKRLKTSTSAVLAAPEREHWCTSDARVDRHLSIPAADIFSPCPWLVKRLNFALCLNQGTSTERRRKARWILTMLNAIFAVVTFIIITNVQAAEVGETAGQNQPRSRTYTTGAKVLHHPHNFAANVWF